MIFTCKDLEDFGIIPENVCVCSGFKPRQLSDHEIFYQTFCISEPMTIIICSAVRQHLLGDKYVLPESFWTNLEFEYSRRTL